MEGRMMLVRPRDTRSRDRAKVELTIEAGDGNLVVKAVIDPDVFLNALMGGSSVRVSYTQDHEECYK